MKDLFRGALRVEKTDEGWAPLRFTDEGLEAWAAHREGWRVRSHCTSAISLAFVTDADEIRMPFAACNFSRVFLGFDVYEDGRLTAHIGFPDSCPEGVLEYTCRKHGEKTIEIYLSCLCQIIVKGLEAGNVRPLPQLARRALFIGDSITQGMTAKCPSLIYPVLYGRKKGVQPIDLGVGGGMFESWQLDNLPDYGPSEIFVAYGINDLAHGEPNDVLLPRAEEFLKKLHAIHPDVPSTVITPIWNKMMEDRPGFPEIYAEYCEALTEIAAGIGYRVVDGTLLLPFDRRHTVDGTHPNEEGFALMTLGLL